MVRLIESNNDHEHEWEYFGHAFKPIAQWETYIVVRVERCTTCRPNVFRETQVREVRVK